MECFFNNISAFALGTCSGRYNVSLSNRDNLQTVISISEMVVLLMIIVTTSISSEIPIEHLFVFKALQTTQYNKTVTSNSLIFLFQFACIVCFPIKIFKNDFKQR